MIFRRIKRKTTIFIVAVFIYNTFGFLLIQPLLSSYFEYIGTLKVENPSEEDKIEGIVTAWDISKAVALNYHNLEEIMTRDVIIALPDDAIEVSARKMREYNISSLPVVDDTGRVIEIITTDHISNLLAGNYK